MNKREYAICSATDTITLAREVSGFMEDGWELVGGPFVGAEERAFEDDDGKPQAATMLFHQAIKKEPQILRRLN